MVGPPARCCLSLALLAVALLAVAHGAQAPLAMAQGAQAPNPLNIEACDADQSGPCYGQESSLLQLPVNVHGNPSAPAGSEKLASHHTANAARSVKPPAVESQSAALVALFGEKLTLGIGVILIIAGVWSYSSVQACAKHKETLRMDEGAWMAVGDAEKPKMIEVPTSAPDVPPVASDSSLATSAGSRMSPRMIEALVVVACAVDAADKALLPACFSALQEDLAASPLLLGSLSFFQTLAFSLTMPLWGLAVAYWSPGVVLALGCYTWGIATALMATSYNFHTHCFLRFLNGAALSAVTPIAQTFLCEVVPETQRGAAFGRMQACQNLACMMTVTYAVSLQGRVFTPLGDWLPLHGWQLAHLQIALCSIMLGVLIQWAMPSSEGSSSTARTRADPTGLLRKILQIPSFGFLVLQGMSGAVPWNALAFITMYWQLRGFSNVEVGMLAGVQQLGSTVGAMFGGLLGDCAASRDPDRGRPFVALVGKILGTAAFAMIMKGVPQDPAHFHTFVVLLFVFGLTSSWSMAGANLPICADLVHSVAERAQIVSMWLLLEGISASVLGAPLVGWLSEAFGYRLTHDAAAAGLADPSSANALAKALVGIVVVSWTACCLAWVGMLFTLPADRARARQQLLADRAEKQLD